MFEIKSRHDLSDVTFALDVIHPELARAAHPGQFVIVMTHRTGERIPLTIADADPAGATVTLVIQAVGKTTREMQDECRAGGHLFAVVGPMGVPAALPSAGTVVCVGGGLGVAPVFPYARALSERGVRVLGILGFRTQALVFWEDRFRRVCHRLSVCTDDGSHGQAGLVSEVLAATLTAEPVDEVVAIGPPRMMQACAEATRPFGVRTMVSLNPIMVDGTGMCGGCRVRVGGQTRFACVDGPDFDGHQVDFAELMTRLGRFHKDERLAAEHYRERCRLSGKTHELRAADPRCAP